MKWIKTSKTITDDSTTITYSLDGTSWRVESRKRQIPHANGRAGSWEYTSYFVVRDGKDLKELHSLKDAKEFAERIAVMNGEITPLRCEAKTKGE